MKYLTNASGYTLPIGDGVTGHAHPDGSITLIDRNGDRATFSAEQLHGLAELMKLSAGLRAAARRKRARLAYTNQWGDGE